MYLRGNNTCPNHLKNQNKNYGWYIITFFLVVVFLLRGKKKLN